MSHPGIGLELGTTQSGIAVVEEGRAHPVKNHRDNELTPSVVRYPSDGDDPIVGEPAVSYARLYPNETVQRFKPDLNDKDAKFGGIEGTRPNADIARELLANAEKRIGQEIKSVVAPRPIYFNHEGVQSLQTSLDAAGVSVSQMPSEPVAAGYCAQIDKEDIGQYIAVPDLGGGTFDLTIFGYDPENPIDGSEILAHEGTLKLGGNDIDRVILQHFVDCYKSNHGGDPLDDPRVHADWLERATQAKVLLSSQSEVEVLLQAAGNTAEVKISRDDFNALIDDLVKAVRTYTERALDSAKIDPGDIDSVILIGGSARVPIIRQTWEDIFDRELDFEVDPTSAVVKGAAYMAAQDKPDGVIRGKYGEIKFMSPPSEITEHTLGIEVVEDEETMQTVNRTLVEKGSSLPASGTIQGRPVEDDTPYIRLNILQGESPNVDDCKLIAEDYKLEFEQRKEKHMRKITVTVKVNRDGLIELHAESEDGDEFDETLKLPELVSS